RRGHQTAENLRIDQMVAHAQQERTVQKGPGLEHRDAVGALPLFIDDVHDRDSFPCGKYVQRGSSIIPPVAAHDIEAFHPGTTGTGDHALEQTHPVYRDQRLARALLPQPPTRSGGDDETVHGTTARNFAVWLRMKASTIAYASSSVCCL